MIPDKRDELVKDGIDFIKAGAKDESTHRFLHQQREKGTLSNAAARNSFLASVKGKVP